MNRSSTFYLFLVLLQNSNIITVNCLKLSKFFNFSIRLQILKVVRDFVSFHSIVNNRNTTCSQFFRFFINSLFFIQQFTISNTFINTLSFTCQKFSLFSGQASHNELQLTVIQDRSVEFAFQLEFPYLIAIAKTKTNHALGPKRRQKAMVKISSYSRERNPLAYSLSSFSNYSLKMLRFFLRSFVHFQQLSKPRKT